MSQYPSPYPQTPYGQPPVDYSAYYQPAADLLKPARRAGILMIVLGVMIALMGTCNGLTAVTLPAEEMAAQQAAMRPPGSPAPPLDPEAMRVATIVMGGITLLVGVAFIVNGLYVRRGSGAAITTALILTGGVALLTGVFLLVCIIAGTQMPIAFGIACVLAIPMALLAWLVIWLIAAARSVSAFNAARTQYQMQMGGYYQQQQAYAQGGYAYGTPQAGPTNPGYGYPSQPQQQQHPQMPPQQQPYSAAPQQQQPPVHQPPPPPAPPAGDSNSPPPPPPAGQ